MLVFLVCLPLFCKPVRAPNPCLARTAFVEFVINSLYGPFFPPPHRLLLFYFADILDRKQNHFHLFSPLQRLSTSEDAVRSWESLAVRCRISWAARLSEFVTFPHQPSLGKVIFQLNLIPRSSNDTSEMHFIPFWSGLNWCVVGVGILLRLMRVHS